MNSHERGWILQLQYYLVSDYIVTTKTTQAKSFLRSAYTQKLTTNKYDKQQETTTINLKDHDFGLADTECGVENISERQTVNVIRKMKKRIKKRINL